MAELDAQTKAVIAADAAHEAGSFFAKQLTADAKYVVDLQSMRGHAARIHSLIWAIHEDALPDPVSFVVGLRYRLEEELTALTKAMNTREPLEERE